MSLLFRPAAQPESLMNSAVCLSVRPSVCSSACLSALPSVMPFLHEAKICFAQNGVNCSVLGQMSTLEIFSKTFLAFSEIASDDRH